MPEDLPISILNRLKASEGQWLDFKSFFLPANQMMSDLEKLQQAGAIIDTNSHQVRLVHWPDRLHPDELSWELGTKLIGRKIQVYEQTASTNDIAWRLLESGEPEGSAIFAESQTGGRGRLGRAWHDAPGKSILVSILLTPRLPLEHIQVLTVFGAVALCEAILELTGHSPTIKWPNDVIFKNQKVAGILVETRSSENQAPSGFVLGIGINVNQCAEDFPPDLRESAASLRSVLGDVFERSALARALLKRLDHHYHRVCAEEYDDLERAWRNLCTAGGQPIRLEYERKEFSGRIVDIDLVDGIILQLPNGALKTFRAEHVTVLPI